MNPSILWLKGLRRVGRAPSMLLALWLATLAVTVPSALALHDSIAGHLGSSLEATTAADGMNYDWLQEFQAQAGQLGRSLRPDVIGFAAVLDNASALADAAARPPVVILSGVVFTLITWFLTPGVICTLAVGRGLGAGTFLSVCGTCVGRLVRMNAISTLVYATLFGSFHQWLFDGVFDTLTRDLTVERTAFVIRVVGYTVFFALLGVCNLVFDVARVRLIVEDRRSVIATIVAALDFIVSNFRSTVGVYVANLATLAAVVGAYAAIAPGVGGAGVGMWAGFLIGQLYIAARLTVKLTFWAGAIVTLQSRLAFDGFVRTLPGTTWSVADMRAARAASSPLPGSV